jgi:hypothetical protein
MMAPIRKIKTTSKISAKKIRISARDPMVELEEGLYMLKVECNAMDVDEAPVYDYMNIDWLGIIEALTDDFPPPPLLIRSVADII